MTPEVFSTRITELCGVPHPILIGGMMWLSTAEFVAAAAKAGVMAFMTPRSYEEPAAFREGLGRCLELAEGRPVGVNLSIPRHQKGGEHLPAYLDIALAAGVRVFETAGAHPGELIAALKAGGGTVIHKSTRIRHALSAERLGADALILVGMEAGGHPGSNPHPAAVLAAHAVPRLGVPLAIGGGVGTGRQLVSTLALGVDAVVMATRFLVAEEIWAHEAYKRRLVAMTEDDTTTAHHTLNANWRVLVNETVRKVQEIEARGATWEEYGELVRGTFTRDNAYRLGAVEKGMISGSSAVGFCDAIEPVEAIVDRIMSEARESLAALNRLAAPGVASP